MAAANTSQARLMPRQPWAGSTRRATLPPDWPAIRQAILNRDGHRCTWLLHPDARRCNAPANQVDHLGDRDDHSPDNLRALCQPHHDKVSSRQGNAARWRHRIQRPEPKHPGLR